MVKHRGQCMAAEMSAIYPPGQTNYFSVSILISPMSEEIFQSCSCYFTGILPNQQQRDIFDAEGGSCLSLPNLLLFEQHIITQLGAITFRQTN